MNPLAYFRWYRRARGGFWTRIPTPLFGASVWIRAGEGPPPTHVWTFWPWGTREMCNGYIDEWHVDGHVATPLSVELRRIFGTADPKVIEETMNAMRDRLHKIDDTSI